MKSFFYKSYFFYQKKFPLQKGKSFFGRIVYKLLGNAVFSFDEVKFELNPLSLIDRMMIEDGNYEDDIFQVIKDNLKKDGGIFLDIGANFGLFTIQAAKLNNVYVFAFEPSRRELMRLQRNALLNSLTNITIFPFAVGDKNYTASLNIAGTSNQSMNSLVNTFPDSKTESIECYALDSIFNKSLMEKIKVIKMDIEGFEYNALLGMNNLLDVYKGPLILEITYYLESKNLMDYNPDDIYDFLSEKGYKSKFGKRHASQYNDYFFKES